MHCPNCGNSLSGDSRFCEACGTKLQPSSASAAFDLPAQTVIDDALAPRVGASIQPAASDMGAPVNTLVGRTIDDKYRLDGILGVGGMGTIYRTTRLMIGDTVAVKILHPEHLRDAQAVERFRREAQAAARLKHPNVVSIYDFGTTAADNLFYLVMELIEGDSLRAFIKRHGRLSLPVAAEVLTQVCAALDEAHRQGVVHRDIKPDNIIVHATANRLHTKVLDFGIAKARDLAASSLTQTGNVVGTPYYMSPEQCLGEEIDARADIYSLGIVMYEMLAGVVPFNSPTSTAVVVQHVTQQPPSLRAAAPHISPAVEAVVLRALEKRREARPQSAGAFAQELAAAISFTTATVTAETFAALPAAFPPHAGGAATTPMDSPTMVMRAPSTWEQKAVARNDANFSGSTMLISPSSGDAVAAFIKRHAALFIVALVVLIGGAFYISRSEGEISDNRRAGSPRISIEQQLEDAITRNNLISPPGASARDFYEQLRRERGQTATARFDERLLSLLTARPQQMLADVAVPGSSDPTPAEWEEAGRMLQWASEIRNNDRALQARAIYCEGRAAHLRESNHQALELWRRACELDPSWALSLNGVGNTLNILQDYPGARQYLFEAMRLEPSWAIPYNNLGTSYFYQQDYDTAESYYLQAVERAPQWFRPHAWLGDIAMRRRDFSRAIAEYEMSLNLHRPGMGNFDPNRVRQQLERARREQARQNSFFPSW